PSGVVLAERALYVPVLLPAALVGCAVDWARRRSAPRAVGLAIAVVSALLAARTLARMPVWRDNRTFLLTLLEEHPESYWGHGSATGRDADSGTRGPPRRPGGRPRSARRRRPHAQPLARRGLLRRRPVRRHRLRAESWLGVRAPQPPWASGSDPLSPPVSPRAHAVLRHAATRHRRVRGTTRQYPARRRRRRFGRLARDSRRAAGPRPRCPGL